jgi:hypothetical protein
MEAGAAGAEAMTDLTFWRQALKQGSYAGLPLHENEPQCGYYRVRNRNGGWGEVAIYIKKDENNPDDPGEMVAIHDGVFVDPDRIWTWCLHYPPITYELYWHIENGGQWPDHLPPLIGSNSGEDIPPEALLKDVLEERAHQLAVWLKQIGGSPRDEHEKGMLGNFQRFFTERERKAEDARKAEKRPFLEGGRAVDEKWNPVSGLAKANKDRCEKIAREVLKREREAAALADAARRQEAAKAGEDSAVLPPAAPPRLVTDSGRSIGLRTFRRVEITDAAALIFHYGNDRRFVEHADVLAVLRRLAKEDIEKNLKVPGAEMRDDERAA